MIKTAELPHNSSVVSALELSPNDQLLTITYQGYVQIWDLNSLSGKPVRLFKFESDHII